MRPPLPADFGTRIDADMLREWRKIRRINQRDLADILGVSYVTVANWERGIYTLPAYLHLALESIDRRLTFAARPPAAPPRPARGIRRRLAAAAG